MQTTPTLSLPLLAASQNQKHITHNEALMALDSLVQLSVISRTISTPPTSPADGDHHIVGGTATGDWQDKEGQIAVFEGSGYRFFEPETGWLAFVEAEGGYVSWTGTEWQPITTDTAVQFGVNTEADSTNRLAVKSDAVLLTHDDVTPGSGNHRLTINKAGASNTASMVFQSNWSGRAEFGLAGDDDWHVKVSPDGANWQEALVANRQTGAVSLPGGMTHALSGAPLRSQIFTPGGNLVSTLWRFDEPRTGFPRQAVIDAVYGDEITLVDSDLYGDNLGQTGPVANKTFFRNEVMQGLVYLRLWNVSKSPAQSAWVRASSGASGLLVTDSAHISGWLAGETVQLGEPNLAGQKVVAVDVSQFLALHTGVVFRQAGLSLNAGVSAQGAGGWYGHIGVTPDGSGGSYTNITSASPDHEGSFSTNSGLGGGFINGFVQVGCTELSPISNSNLLFVREQDNGAGALRIGALTAVGVWV